MGVQVAGGPRYQAAAAATGSGVTSVNGDPGPDVILDADDIDDTSTTHKFTNAADITRLADTSGTNTGDQDLSGYALDANAIAYAIALG